MNEFARRNFNTILFLFTVAGFIVPQPGANAGHFILVVLALIIFSSSFKVRFSTSFFRAHAAIILGFYVLRFIVLPVVVFWAVMPFSSFYASSLFLLCVLPAGVTAPALTNVFGGNISLALALLIISSFFTPFLLPLLSGALMQEVLEIDRFRLFITLFATVILPYLLHLPLRSHARTTQWMQHHDSFISIVGIGLIFALAIATYRPILLGQPQDILPYVLAAFTAFVGLYFFGWFACYKSPKADRLAVLFNSGANNVALGVVISFLYFPVSTGVFFIVCEIVWVLILIPVKKIIGGIAGEASK